MYNIAQNGCVREVTHALVFGRDKVKSSTLVMRVQKLNNSYPKYEHFFADLTNPSQLNLICMGRSAIC